MLGTKPMSRRAAAIGATLLSAGLALSGCGNPSPGPTGDSSIIVPPQTPQPTSSTGTSNPEGSVPELPGFELLFSTRYERPQTLLSTPDTQTTLDTRTTPDPRNSATSSPSSPGTSLTPAFDGLLVSDDYVAVYSNDLSTKTYEITGYRVSSSAQEWSHEGNGILSCHDGDIVVCETKSYSGGVWTTEDAWLFSMNAGGFQALDVGAVGTFSYVGYYDDAVYFLTWDGTRSVHMTGFDESGVPVVDKNLKVSAPAVSERLNLETWMNGSHALITFAGETPVLYNASTNLFADMDVTVPCVSLDDGAVCTSAEDPAILIGIDQRVREVWRHATKSVTLLDASSDDVSLKSFEELFLISPPSATMRPDPGIEPGPGHPTPGKTAAATPGTSSAQFTSASIAAAGEKTDPELRPTLRGDFPTKVDWLYATVSDEKAMLLALTDDALLLPGERKVTLGGQMVESVDLSDEVAIVNVSAVDPSPGEAGATRVFSSILVGKDGTVLSSLPSAQVAEIFEQASVAGQQIQAHTFTWKDDYLVFSDPSQGIVAVYERSHQ